MAVADSTALVNMALARCGHKKINDIDDDNKAARSCALHYANERDILLTSFPWHFAKKNVYLENKTYESSGNLTFADADPDTITDSAASFVTTGGIIAGMRVTPSLASGTLTNGGTYTVATAVDATLTLISDDSLTAEGPTGSIILTLRRSQEYDFAFAKPSDYLTTTPIHSKSSNLNLSQNYIVEGDYLYANDADIQLEYVAQITDATKFTAIFINALYLKIAAQICTVITENRLLQKDIIAEWTELQKRMQLYEAKEGQPDRSPPSSSFKWISGR